MEGLSKESLVELYQFISNSYRTKADDIFCALEFLIEGVREVKEEINQSIRKKTGEGGDCFDDISMLSQHGKDARSIEEFLKSYMDIFAVTLQNSEMNYDETESAEDEKEIPNYKDYEVDTEVPHLLSESFTYKKVCGFFLCNVRYNVADWKSMLIRICEILYDKNSALFKKTVFSDRFVGNKIRYFSETNENKYYRKIKNANIYVWTCHSANAMCSIIRKLLMEFNIPSSSLYIYLRADYTPLHSDSVGVDRSIENDGNKEIKIGKFVRTKMGDLSISNYRFEEQMLDLLLTEEYTKNKFGVGLPFFKEIKDESRLSELIKDSNGVNRYWREMFEFNGRKFAIISQWTKNNADRFHNWLNNLPKIEKYLNMK